MPNTAPMDPEFAGTTRFGFGLTGPQPFLDAGLLAMIIAAYALERRAIEKGPGAWP